MLPGRLPFTGRWCVYQVSYTIWTEKGRFYRKKSEIFCILSEAGAGVRVSGVVADGCSVGCYVTITSCLAVPEISKNY